jgi:hypothetical protein
MPITESKTRTRTLRADHLEIIHDALDSDEMTGAVEAAVQEELTRRGLEVVSVEATYRQTSPATDEMLESGALDVTAELATEEDGALDYFVIGATVLALHRLGVDQA